MLTELLGAGGFGKVWRAWDSSLGRFVALKLLLCSDEQMLQRFQREARVLARLSHPNIVQVFESGILDGKPYLAMELISGTPLSRMRLDTREAAQVVQHCALALHEAHQSGIIHRDLKPQNIVVRRRRELEGAESLSRMPRTVAVRELLDPVVLDFGLARPLAPGSTLTAAKLAVGTPAYMAPEQAAGERERIGPATDVYSLGATLYELITERAPFQGEDPLAVLRELQFTDPPEPRRLRPQLPRDLEAIVVKAMAKSPEGRYPTALALAEELARFLRGEGVTARPVGWRQRLRRRVRKHPTAAAVLATVCLVGLLLAGWAIHSRLSSRAEHRLRLAAVSGALERARRESNPDLLAEAHRSLGAALQAYPEDPEALRLSAELVQAEQEIARAVKRLQAAELLRKALGRLEGVSSVAPSVSRVRQRAIPSGDATRRTGRGESRAAEAGGCAAGLRVCSCERIPLRRR